MKSSLANMLLQWAKRGESDWTAFPNGHGVYGTGYNAWGTQTQQKYVAALGALATAHETAEADQSWACERALQALRFNLDSHLSGPGACLDGTQWGHTWISALGIERMMSTVYRLTNRFSDADEAALKRVLVSEAEWLLTDYRRGPHVGIRAGLWNHEGANDPESNLWNGCLLWRTAAMYPDHLHAADWMERAHCFFINAVSIADDAMNEKILGGKPIHERFIGPNFFPNYALDHHGYLNIGYMIICLSNAAMLHFDAKLAGFEAPDSLYHHQSDLWTVVRRFIFGNGRLARIGGDTRYRYAYCQDYLLPTLLYAADRFQDAHAKVLFEQQLELIRTETAHSGDGYFYSKRLAALRKKNLYYYTRLESDRAAAIAMALNYSEFVSLPSPPEEPFENSAAGSWSDPDHGAVMHRSPTRLAAFSWRAFGLMQGLCQPPSDGHLAEWQYNLAGKVDFMHHPRPSYEGAESSPRELGEYQVSEFSGGFATWGWVKEGARLSLLEGWNGASESRHQVVFIALPDERTVIGLQYCRTGATRTYPTRIAGLHFNLPNDFYNANERVLQTSKRKTVLGSPPAKSQIRSLGKWVNIENQLGLVGLSGAKSLQLSRSPHPRDGQLASLQIEQIGYPILEDTRPAEANSLILDVAWAVLSSASEEQTRHFAQINARARLRMKHPEVRGLKIQNHLGSCFWIYANFGSQSVTLRPEGDWDLMNNSQRTSSEVRLPAGAVALYESSTNAELISSR